MSAKAIAKLAIMCGFSAGAGFLAAQELWWLITGLVGLCHG